jgi:glutaredoxin/glutathione-dependent peroxiredoxin
MTITATITVGQTLPAGSLTEFIEVEGNGCSLGPNTFQVTDLLKGKKVVIFGLPGAYTPTCSAKHLPSFVEHSAALKAKGVDEVWCLATNDAFVMGAWGRDNQVAGKVRMFADGNVNYTKALGLELDLSAHGMGVRTDRFAMIVNDGVATWVGREAGGKYEVSSAEHVLTQL